MGLSDDSPGESGDVYGAFAYTMTAGGNCPYSLFTPEACDKASKVWTDAVNGGTLRANPKSYRMYGDPMVYMGTLYGNYPESTLIGSPDAKAMIAAAAQAVGISSSDYIEPKLAVPGLPNLSYDHSGNPVPYSPPSWLQSVLPADSQLTKGLVTNLNQLQVTSAPTGPSSVQLPSGQFLSLPSPAPLPVPAVSVPVNPPASTPAPLPAIQPTTAPAGPTGIMSRATPPASASTASTLPAFPKWGWYAGGALLVLWMLKGK